MVGTPLRQAATVLLDSAIRVAPPEARDWGQAMRGELGHVDGAWAALMWALGGASLMAKHALLSLLFPRQDIVPGDALFARTVSLRKVALGAGAGCVVAALMFFAAPPFRQAFRVALEPWVYAFRIASRDFQPGLETLARRAEAQHDPEGIAFAALRLRDPRRSARLAEEAVRLDPSLLWVYAVVAMRYPDRPEISRWVSQLECGDHANALPYLIEADSVIGGRWRRGEWKPPTAEEDQAWQRAMTAAFQSTKFDDYLDRIHQLNRRVIPRYSFYDPYEVAARGDLFLPIFAFEHSERFARSMLQSGADLEARGDAKGARDKYWSVARYGQMVDSQGRTSFEHWTGTSLQALAYKQLQVSAEKGHDRAEAALFSYLAAKFDPVTGERPKMHGDWAFGMDTSRRNAAVVEISGLMILVFSMLVVVAASILIVGSRRGARPSAQRARPAATMVVLTSAVGLLFSAVTLYVTYRPYWYMFQSAILNGGSSQAGDLRDFLMETQRLPGLSPRLWMSLSNALLYSGSPSFLFYVWTGVTLLGVSGLVLILLRHIFGRPRAGASV